MNVFLTDKFKIVCGIDEAGRGPLCGPVCAAAVILPEGFDLSGIDDSKKLSEKKREAAYDRIVREADWSAAFASPEEIDEMNILQATFLAMRRAVDGLRTRPEYALIDGNGDPGLNIPSELVVKGDATYSCIAAASIVAKVTRDRYMSELALKYPEYKLESHKGYPTKEHYKLIKEFGIQDFYRKSFLKKMH